MRRKPALFFAGLTLGALALAGCTSSPETTTAGETATQAEPASDVSNAYTELNYGDLGIDDAAEVDASKAVDVALADGGSTAVAGVSVDGDIVTITAAGTYRLAGSLSAGSVVVDVDSGQVNLILDGVSITSADTAAINVVSADAVVVSLAGGSTNTLSDAATTAESTDEDAPNAVLFSTADLYIEGEGSLTIKATIDDGITSKDSLIIEGGTITVDSVDDGVRGKDHIVVRDGLLTINAGGDGIKADNDEVATDATSTKGVAWFAGGTIDITAGDDGVSAAHQVTVAGGAISIDAKDDGIHSDGLMRASDGDVTIAQSYEGLESAVMLLSGGAIDVTASDDGINIAGGIATASTATSGTADATQQGAPAGGDGRANGGPGGGGQPAGGQPGGGGGGGGMGGDASVVDPSALTVTTSSGSEEGPMPGTTTDTVHHLEVSGGTISVDAEGDGVDVNGSFTMTGGELTVAGTSANNNTAVDVDTTYTISGGSLVASGSSGMLVAPDADSSQGTVVAVFNGGVAAGSEVSVSAADGTVVGSFTTVRTSQSIVVSSADIVSRDDYTVTVAGVEVGAVAAS